MITILFVAALFLALRASSECSFFTNCVNFTINQERIFVKQSLMFKCSVSDEIGIDVVKIIARKENASWDLLSTPLDNKALQAFVPYTEIQNDTEYFCCRKTCQQVVDLSEPLQVHLKDRPPPPEDFHCVSYSLQHLHCIWSEPNSSNIIWNLTYTNTFPCTRHMTAPTSASRKIEKQCRKNHQTVNCTILHNTQDRLYHFYLSAADMLYNYTVCYNDQIVKLEILWLEVNAVSSHSIRVSWELMQDYFVEGIDCQIDYFSEWGDNSSIQLKGSQRKNYFLDNLQPYTEYNIRLQCSVHGSYPGIPQNKTIRTSPEAPFIGPLTTNTSYVKCGKKCVLVYLQEPSAFCTQGNILRYIVHHNGMINITHNLTTVQINDYNSGDQIKIFSVNSVGTSKIATTLILNTNDKECVQIKDVTVKHHNVTSTLKRNLIKPREFIFHKCTGNFTAENICHGKYRFYTSSENNKIFNSSLEGERFGVSVALPRRSLGIYWQDAEPTLANTTVTTTNSTMAVTSSSDFLSPESTATSENTTATASTSPLPKQIRSPSSINAPTSLPQSTPTTRKNGVTTISSSFVKKENMVSKGFIPAIVVAAVFCVLFILVGGRKAWIKVRDTFHSFDIDVPDITQNNDKTVTVKTDSSNVEKSNKETEVTKLYTSNNMSSNGDNNVPTIIQRQDDDDFTNSEYEIIDAKQQITSLNLDQQRDESFDSRQINVYSSETLEHDDFKETSNDEDFLEFKCDGSVTYYKSSIEYSKFISVMSSGAYSSGDTTYTYSQSEDDDDNEQKIDTKDCCVIENHSSEDYFKIANSSALSTDIQEQSHTDSASSDFSTEIITENFGFPFLSDKKDMEGMSDYIKACKMGPYTASTSVPLYTPHSATHAV